MWAQQVVEVLGVLLGFGWIVSLRVFHSSGFRLDGTLAAFLHQSLPALGVIVRGGFKLGSTVGIIGLFVGTGPLFVGSVAL